MNKELELKIAIQKELQKISDHKKPYSCLIPNCENQATTTSHVLQQSKILKSILDKTNHFYTIKQNDLFKMKNDGPLKFKRSSLKNTFKFPLYCRSHDDQVFSSIEKKHPIDWSNRRNILLQTYRTICMEFRKKEIYIDCIKAFADHRRNIVGTTDYFDLRPAELSIKDMNFYKTEIENEIFYKKAPRYVVNTFHFPKKEICFSSALSIHDAQNPKSQGYDEYGYTKKGPITATFLNFFPYQNKSILLSVQHNDFLCNWTRTIEEEIKTKEKYNKVLSDLLTYRIEEWAVSTNLYQSLSSDKKEKFLSESVTYSDYFEYELQTNFNLFEE
jgi:hypothetical protein